MKEKDNPRLLLDPIAIFLSIQVGVPLVIILVILYADVIERYPVVSGVVTVSLICAFGILWFLRKLNK